MSDFDRIEEARERNDGLEYEERWEEDRYDRDGLERDDEEMERYLWRLDEKDEK